MNVNLFVKIGFVIEINKKIFPVCYFFEDMSVIAVNRQKFNTWMAASIDGKQLNWVYSNCQWSRRRAGKSITPQLQKGHGDGAAEDRLAIATKSEEIPAKYIANYLRMTPETLSRVKGVKG